MSQPQATPQTEPARDTYVYKVVSGREIEADVIGADAGASKPSVVWIHGGGLIFGSRTISPRPPFLAALLEAGFVVVSIDHRLAPETKLPDIVEDVRDAWAWIRTVGKLRFGIDPACVAMAGGSAGAYLSLIAGHLFEPRPRALASFWGYGDITASWEAEPSAYYRQMGLVRREEADASLTASPIPDPAVDVDRSCFYLYCRQQGKWLQEVTGHDSRKDDAWFERYCPIRNLNGKVPADCARAWYGRHRRPARGVSKACGSPCRSRCHAPIHLARGCRSWFRRGATGAGGGYGMGDRRVSSRSSSIDAA